MNTAFSSFNLPTLNLPTLHVQPLGDDVWNNLTYIPFASNIKGAVDIFIGTALLVASVGLAILTTIASPFIFIGAGAYGWIMTSADPFFGPIEKGIFALLSAGVAGGLAIGSCLALTTAVGLMGIYSIAYGAIESIPVAGNLALGFYNGKIQIIPN